MPHSGEHYAPTSAENALEKGLAGLQRAAADLGANAIAVLVAEACALEILYPRGRDVGCPPEIRDALNGGAGPVPAGTGLAHFLQSAVAACTASFLLFPWRGERRVVTIVFGFAAPVPPHTAVPEHVLQNLNLAALAAWSMKEAARLREELRVVNQQLASRKTVERAKSFLQAERGLTEQQAYEFLRKLSRQRRIAISKVAEELIRAPQCISAGLKSRAG